MQWQKKWPTVGELWILKNAMSQWVEQFGLRDSIIDHLVLQPDLFSSVLQTLWPTLVFYLN